MGQGTYDPRAVIITYAGRPINPDSFAAGSFITVEYNEEPFESYVGDGGGVSWARKRNQMGKVTLKLAATSLDNDILSAIANEDLQRGGQIKPFRMTDLNGTSIAKGMGRLGKMPKVEFGGPVGEREWMVNIEKLEMAVGGTTAI
jgi:hypothetical protein